MVVCAVRYEPVSACNSLLTGKLTGNFAISGLLEAISEQKAPVPQPLLSKFPTKINREIIFGNREISDAEQGNLHRSRVQAAASMFIAVEVTDGPLDATPGNEGCGFMTLLPQGVKVHLAFGYIDMSAPSSPPQSSTTSSPLPGSETSCSA